MVPAALARPALLALRQLAGAAHAAAHAVLIAYPPQIARVHGRFAAKLRLVLALRGHAKNGQHQREASGLHALPALTVMKGLTALRALTGMRGRLAANGQSVLSVKIAQCGQSALPDQSMQIPLVRPGPRVPRAPKKRRANRWRQSRSNCGLNAKTGCTASPNCWRAQALPPAGILNG